MQANKNIKNKIIKFLWIIIAMGIVGVLIAAIKYNKETVCSQVKINMLGEKEKVFLQEKDIKAIINSASIENILKIKDVDIKNMELALEKNVWIDNVELFFDKKGILNIDVQQREPICRIFTNNGNSFFIDRANNILPINNAYAIEVPVFTGLTATNGLTKQDSITLQSINVIAQYLNSNPLWLAQIQQVAVMPNKEFEFIPTFGNHTVMLGDTSQLDSKFKRLKIFYKNVLSKVGFDKYATINVKFKNQIVVSKNNGKVIDTTLASNSIQNFLLSTADSALQIQDTITKREPSNSDSLTRTRTQQAIPTPANRPRTVTTPNNNNNRNNINSNRTPIVPPRPARAVMPARPRSENNRNN